MAQRLTAAISTYAHTLALKRGEVKPEGVDLQFVDVQPQIAAYRRMIRDLEFDICELAPSTYLIAREAGAPIVALPVFLTRSFHHSEFVCPIGRSIRTPKDLEG